MQNNVSSMIWWWSEEVPDKAARVFACTNYMGREGRCE